MNEDTRQAIEAASFRHLVDYLREHTERIKQHTLD